MPSLGDCMTTWCYGFVFGIGICSISFILGYAVKHLCSYFNKL